MDSQKKLLIIFIFNMSLMALEAAGGLLSHSLALLSDAGHMLTDSMAVLLSYMAMQWSKKPATTRKTFGYHRLEILVSLVNGLVLVLVAGYIITEAIQRFFNPVAVKTGLLLGIATAGLAGNLFGVFMLHKDSEHSMNIRSTFLHLMSDTLSSVGVIIGGMIIVYTGWNIVDSVIGILIGGLVLRGAVSLIIESGEVLMEAAPSDIDPEILRQDIEKIPGIKELHDTHIWTITSGRRALSGHLLTENMTIIESENILCNVRKLLAEKFNITHTTLEVECESCGRNVCEFHKPEDKGHT